MNPLHYAWTPEHDVNYLGKSMSRIVELISGGLISSYKHQTLVTVLHRIEKTAEKEIYQPELRN